MYLPCISITLAPLTVIFASNFWIILPSNKISPVYMRPSLTIVVFFSIVVPILKFIFLEQTFHFHFQHPEYGLAYNGCAHLGFPSDTIGEDYGYFYDLIILKVGPKLHFDLERIANKFNGINVYRFQNLPFITYESGSWIMYFHSCDQLYVKGGPIGQ